MTAAERSVLASGYRCLSARMVELDRARGAALPIAMQKTATVQSALRTLLSGAPYWHSCPLQIKAFERVRDLAAEHRIYVSRHLRANDPADPCELQSAVSHSPQPRRAGEGIRPKEGPQLPEPADPLVVAARGLLKGKRLLLIGGDDRDHTGAALVAGLQLDDLRWISTSRHCAHAPIRQAIISGATDVVAIAIRWSSHSFSELAQLARQNGKPLIRLPAGLGLNQVAYQVLAQLSEDRDHPPG